MPRGRLFVGSALARRAQAVNICISRHAESGRSFSAALAGI